jgi:hypothetical protein
VQHTTHPFHLIISLTQQLQTMTERTKERSRPPNTRELFDALDADGGGTINLREFREAFKMMVSNKASDGDQKKDGVRALMKSVDKQFKEADMDGNGSVDFEEFVKLMTDLDDVSSHPGNHGSAAATAADTGALLTAAANALRLRRYVAQAMHTTPDPHRHHHHHPHYDKENSSPSGVRGKRGTGRGACAVENRHAAEVKAFMGREGATPQPRTPQSQPRCGGGGGGLSSPSSSSTPCPSLPAAASVFSSMGRRGSRGRREAAAAGDGGEGEGGGGGSGVGGGGEGGAGGTAVVSSAASREQSTPFSSSRRLCSPAGGGVRSGSPMMGRPSSSMSELDDELAEVERMMEQASARRQDTWQERPRRRTPTPTGSSRRRGGGGGGGRGLGGGGDGDDADAGAADKKEKTTTPQPRCHSTTPTLPRLATTSHPPRSCSVEPPPPPSSAAAFFSTPVTRSRRSFSPSASPTTTPPPPPGSRRSGVASARGGSRLRWN